MGFHSKKSVNQLFFGHFQTEDCHCHILTECHILSNIQNKSRLSHRRTSCNKHQIRSMHARRFIVQIHKACRDSGDRSLKLGSFLNVIDSIKHNLLDWHIFLTVSLLQNMEQFLFRLFQDHLCTLFLKITGIGNLFVRFDQASKDRFLAYNLCIILYQY